jgi:hypothetical protein
VWRDCILNVDIACSCVYDGFYISRSCANWTRVALTSGNYRNVPKEVTVSCFNCVYNFIYNYCDVLPGNASSNLWILDFMLGLLVMSSGGI